MSGKVDVMKEEVVKVETWDGEGTIQIYISGRRVGKTLELSIVERRYGPLDVLCLAMWRGENETLLTTPLSRGSGDLSVEFLNTLARQLAMRCGSHELIRFILHGGITSTEVSLPASTHLIFEACLRFIE